MASDPTAPGGTRVGYVTARLPFGATEPFLIPELEELERLGCDLTLVPVRPGGAVVHADARPLLAGTAAVPLLSARVAAAALAELARAPVPVARAALVLRASRSRRILLKNLAVLPKALWLGRLLRRTGAVHVHAHWAGTSSTLAMLAARVAGVPWSFTAHRWDIAEDNLLAAKARSACFVRAISDRGAEELRRRVGDPAWEPLRLNVGVRLPARPAVPAAGPPLRTLTAASFVEVKGHGHLLDALARLRERGVAVRAELAGDGELEAELRRRAAALGLADEVAFLGRVSHDELLAGLAGGRWHAVVLPSVVGPGGAQEGIPVSLVEALACGLPVVGTETGGIPELLGDGAGLLVPPADPEALAGALARLAADPALGVELGARGRRRVEDAFAAERVAAALLERFRTCGRPA